MFKFEAARTTSKLCNVDTWIKTRHTLNTFIFGQCVGHCENVSRNILCVADLLCVCVLSLVSPGPSMGTVTPSQWANCQICVEREIETFE
jgi:hypothetical protein